MDTQTINGVTLYYDPPEKDAADQLAFAIQRSLDTITNTWQLPVPGDCRVYLMVSWPRCVFLGAPISSQILLALTLPMWYREFKLRWLYAGGWSQRYGHRQVVGVKAPRMLADTPQAMGESLFVEEDDLDLKYLSIVCHELTHACSAHLDLPSWLNEGLAMVSVDRCLEKQTVLSSTLELLRSEGDGRKTADAINLQSQSREEIILLYTRGYWLTRYLAEKDPDLLEAPLLGKIPSAKIEPRIAEALDIPQDHFWEQIDRLLIKQFS